MGSVQPFCYCGKREQPLHIVTNLFNMNKLVGVKEHSVLKDYDIGRSLGFSHYGEIRIVAHKKTKKSFVIKKIPLVDDDFEEIKQVFTEIKELMNAVIDLIN
jgi:serine/threonine protein kinase